jgi:hypothetical protein
MYLQQERSREAVVRRSSAEEVYVANKEIENFFNAGAVEWQRQKD